MCTIVIALYVVDVYNESIDHLFRLLCVSSPPCEVAERFLS
jgi:hypothetical protein